MAGEKHSHIWAALLTTLLLSLTWVFFVLIAIPHAAVHLCRWPATISCETGVPTVWWLLDGGLTLIVACGLLDSFWLSFRTRTTRRYWRVTLYSLWSVNLFTLFIVSIPDRELSSDELVLGTLITLAGLALAVWSVASLPPIRRSRVLSVTAWTLAATLAVSSIITVALSPGWFERARSERSDRVSPTAPTSPAPTPPVSIMHR